MHLNTLNVPLRVDVPDPGSARMELYPHAFNQVEQALPAIRDHNLAVFLEPFPWVQNGALPETAWKPKYEQDWFRNWSKICLQAAWFAQSNGIQTLVISDGIAQMEPYPENWLELNVEAIALRPTTMPHSPNPRGTGRSRLGYNSSSGQIQPCRSGSSDIRFSRF